MQTLHMDSACKHHRHVFIPQQAFRVFAMQCGSAGQADAEQGLCPSCAMSCLAGSALVQAVVSAESLHDSLAYPALQSQLLWLRQSVPW